MYGIGVVTQRGGLKFKLSKVGQDVLVLSTKDGFSEYNMPYRNRIMFSINDRRTNRFLTKRVVRFELYFSPFALASILKHVKPAGIHGTAT